MKKIKFKILSVLLAVVFVFAVFEIVLRIQGMGYDNAGFENDKILHHVHKKDYVFVNDNPADLNSENFEIYYDEEGCVSSESYINTSEEDIIILGDSYLEGAQVPFDSSITKLLQVNFPEYRIKNYATGSYSPVLYNLQWREFIEVKRVKKVLIQLYANDVIEDSLYLSRATIERNNIIAVNGGDVGVIRNFARKFYVFRWLRKVYMQWQFDNIEDKSNFKIGKSFSEANMNFKGSLTEIQLEELVASISSEDIEVYLILIPSRYKMLMDSSFESKFNIQIKEKYGNDKRLHFIDLQKRIEEDRVDGLFFSNDIHFNVKGHQYIGSILREELRK